MNINFSISEFCIDGNTIPTEVADKLLKYHIPILQDIRNELGLPIIISEKSGYRPYGYEKSEGRSGTSEHCFAGKGAVDIECSLVYSTVLLDMLKESAYTRVCYYPNSRFIHCDFKATEKQYFVCSNGSNWVLQ